jgi:predicted amidophosphoribosyltransferase
MMPARGPDVAAATCPAGIPVRRAEPDETGHLFQCALCGAQFSHGMQACGGCPLRLACDVVRCPSCGYQFPRSSRLAAWLGRLWGVEEDS